MRFFLAGIMQGSHVGPHVHEQDYRLAIRDLVAAHFPEADIYDPRENHAGSLDYDEATGRQVFMDHNRMCGEVDVLLAFVPEASMGTAIEMWEAYCHGTVVITISPMEHNWAIRFLSHARYDDVDEFALAVADGRVAEVIRRVRETAT